MESKKLTDFPHKKDTTEVIITPKNEEKKNKKQNDFSEYMV